MSAHKPGSPRPASHEDAQLILKLYELRREEKMRAARDWYATKFTPKSFDDVKAVLSGVSEEATSFRMVTRYWDMAASFVTHGVLNAELFFASAEEMLFVWAKVEEYILQIRRESGSPLFLENVQRLIGSVPWASERVRLLRERMGAFRLRGKSGERPAR